MKIPEIGFPLGTHPTAFEFYGWTKSILNEGRYQLRVISSPPDWTTNDGEILAVDEDGQKSLYMFVTDTWYSVPLTQAGTGGTVPTGGIIPYGGSTSTLPSGWALCNGAAISRADYAQLFSVIGTTFGPGDGSTTFNLPDLRDRFPIGAAGTYPVGGAGGSFTTSSDNGGTGNPSNGGGTPYLQNHHTHTYLPQYCALLYIIKL